MVTITNSKSDSTGKYRVYVAEQLESRILYSAAPAEAPVEESPAENSSSEKADFESIEDFCSSSETNPTDTLPESTDQSVILTSLNNLTSVELAILSEAATGRWVEAGISDGQLDALQQISYKIVDLEADILGSAEGYQIEIDINAAGKGWFIDTTPFQDEEFGIVHSATAFRTEEPVQFGVDLLSVLMHEQGHVLGLEDIYDSIGETSVMYGLFDEGERRIATDGEADGSIAGSLEDIHYAVFDGAADSNPDPVSGDINQATNYTGDTLPSSTDGVYTEVIILDGDAVTALNPATTEVTIDVGSSTTFAATGNALQFDGTGVSFTVGAGAIGEQTFTLANDSDIRASNDIDQVQTINANIVLGTAGNNVINTGVAGSTLVINGKIDGGAAGEPLLIFTGRGTAVINGSIGSETTVEQISVYAGTVQTDAANLNNTRLSYFRLGHQAVTGTLELIGTEDVSVASQLMIGNNSLDAVNNGGSTLLNNGSGVVTFSNTSFNYANYQNKSAKDLTLGGTNTGRNLIAGSIDNNNTVDDGLVNLIKQDEGTWVLGGDNGYTGTTTISAGRLDFDGSNTTNISVSSGATLGGSGSTTGSIAFSDGSAIAVNDSTGAFTAETVTVEDNVNDKITVKLDSYDGSPITILNFDPTTSNISADNFVLDTSANTFQRAVFTESSPGVITLTLSFEVNTWTGTDTDAPTEWDNYGEDNWANSYDSKYSDGDYVKFSDSLIESGAPSSDQTIVLMEDVKPSTITFSNDNIAYEINDNGSGESISGSTTLSKTGEAEVTINSSNSYTGNTYLTQGILNISTDTALGSGTVLIYDNGVTPQLILDSNGMVIANDFVIQEAGSTKQIRFDPDGTGNSAEFAGDFNLLESTSGSFEIYAGEGDTLIFSGLLSGTGNPRIRGGIVVLNNDDNSFDNPLRIDGGTTEITSIANGGVNSAAGSGIKIFLGAIYDDGVLSYTGSGDSTDRQIQICISLSNESIEYTGGGVIENNGANGGSGLIFTNPTLNTPETASGIRVGERTLTLGGTNTDANEIRGAIIDNDGESGANTINLVKDGEGVWTLSGINTYTGTTTVNAGTLYINGSTAAGAVSVAAGATLGGTGTVNGAITSVGGTITGGTGDTPGTLTAAGGLTLDSDSTFEAKFNSTSIYSQIIASGTVDLGGATLSLDFETTPPAGTEFILINGDTPITGTFSGFPDETSVTIDGHKYTVNYDSYDVVLTYLGEAGVPEQHFTEVDSAVSFDFSEFGGTGFASDPVDGQLDSDQWVITGMSDGDGTLGGTYTTGDFSRGENDGGTGTGGVYAFDIDNTSGFDPALGIQPGGSDFTPGGIILKITNQTGSTLTGADVDFDVAIFNDQSRSNSLSLQFATAAAADADSVPDASQFTDVANSTVTSNETADESPAWVITGKSLILTDLNLADGDSLFLLWTGDDVGGSGSRDEFALDNIVVTPRVNVAPEITGGETATASFAENASPTNMVYDVETTDDKDTEGSGLTYSFTTTFGGADNDKFNLDTNTGEISFKTSPDFEIAGDANSDNDYEIEITVTDGSSLTDVQNITVSVTNENDNSPVITSEAAVEVEEGTTTVTTVTATDGDGDTATYSLTGGADQDAFSIDANTGELTFNSSPDFGTPGDSDADNIYEVEVTASDGANSDVQSVTVTVTEVAVNIAPLVSADSDSVSATEGSPANNSGTFSDTIDDIVTITASAGTVVQDNTDGTWSWSYTPEDGPDDSRSVTISATDSENAVTTTTFELTVANADPVAGVGFSITTDEDTDDNVFLLTGATDPAGVNDTLTIDTTGYTNNGDGTFSKSTDQGGIITVNPFTGEATYTPAINFNGTDSFSFAVQDEDGGLSTTENVSILVNPVNDAPLPNGDSNTASNIISEDIADGDEVGITANFSDVEGDAITYSLIDDADGAFEIDPATGVVTVADRTKLDFGSSSLFPIVVEGSDGKGGVQTQQFSIATVKDNELVPFIGIFDDNGLTGVVAAQDSENSTSLTLVTILDQAQSELELILTNQSTGEKLFYSPGNIDRINGFQSITIGGSIFQNLSQYSAVLKLGGRVILEFEDAEDLLDELSGNESTPGWLTSFYQFHDFDSSLV